MLFRNVVIFGAGTMGHAIALRFARGGHAVTLTDVDRDALDRAERSIRRLAGTQSEQLGGEAPESVMARLRLRRTDSEQRLGPSSSSKSFRNGWTSSAVFTRNWPASCPRRP